MNQHASLPNSTSSCIWFFDAHTYTLDQPRSLPGASFASWFEYATHSHSHALHGYFILPDPILGSSAQLMMPHASVYSGNLSIEEIEEYCRQSEMATAGPFTHGTPPYFHATYLHLHGILRCLGRTIIPPFNHSDSESQWQSSFGSLRPTQYSLFPSSQYSTDNWIYFNPRPYKTSSPIPISSPDPCHKIARMASHSHTNTQPTIIYHSEHNPSPSPISDLIKNIYDQSNK